MLRRLCSAAFFHGADRRTRKMRACTPGMLPCQPIARRGQRKILPVAFSVSALSRIGSKDGEEAVFDAPAAPHGFFFAQSRSENGKNAGLRVSLLFGCGRSGNDAFFDRSGVQNRRRRCPPYCGIRRSAAAPAFLFWQQACGFSSEDRGRGNRTGALTGMPCGMHRISGVLFRERAGGHGSRCGSAFD